MKLYTTRQAADNLGINHVTLLRYISMGKIKARKAMLGSGWRFTDGDIEAIRRWRAAPLAVLDLVKLADETPEHVAPQYADLRPDLKLFGEYFPKYKSWAFGEEHPMRLLPHLAPPGGAHYPWSTLESPEYLTALAEHRARPAPLAKLSPEQEATNRLFEQWEREQNDL